MKTLRIIAVALAATFTTVAGAGAAAAAQGAMTIGTLNLRAGPGTQYPVVSVLPGGAPVTLYGCTADTRWCDAAWQGRRGWLAAGYVQVMRAGQPSPITPASVALIGLGVVAFNQAYWDAHYRAMPWYGRWSYYRPGAAHWGHTSCGPNACRHTGVTEGPRGGLVVRHGVLLR